jgi:rod shape-determining protein MreC
MLAIPSRHRSLTLLAVVLGLQLLLLAAQIKREQQVRLIRVWAIEGVTPLGRAAAWISDGVYGAWSGYVALWHMRKENVELRAERDLLKMRNAELVGRAAEAGRLSALLGFREAHSEVPMLPARVIGASPDVGSRIVFLSRGSRDGVRRDLGVITPDGVVGKVLAVFPDTSQVLLLSDKESGVGALLATSRTQAPVNGSGEPLLGMEYVSNEVKVEAGEAVLTSGQDRIFPKDLPVGTVLEAKPDRHTGFQQIKVKPAARLDQLEEVLVLLTRQEFAPRKGSDAPGASPSTSSGASNGASSGATARVNPAAPVATPPPARKLPAASAPASGSGGPL